MPESASSSRGAPWYGGGLRFSCTRCGHCCTGAPGYVWVTHAEAERLAGFLGLEMADFARRYLRRALGRLALRERANGDCVLYDRGCTVYPARPVQCRTFPFWSENLKSAAAWERAREECPGMGSGRLYTLEDIGTLRRGKSETTGGPLEAKRRR